MHELVEKRRRDEEGFTLIELMVVVLIMGILMAIAIPTFLSTRGSANDASAKSNATNAFTNEKSYYASNQQFLAATTVASGETMDSSLPWGAPSSTNLNVVGAYVTTLSPGTSNEMLIAAQSKSGNCFYILDIEQSNSSTIGYLATSGGCTNITPSTAPTIYEGSSGVVSVTTKWYQSW